MTGYQSKKLMAQSRNPEPDDLVKRLRMTDMTMHAMTLVIVAREAADRIEALEAALLKISDLDCYLDDAKQFYIGYFGEIARAALAGEKKDD